MGADGGSAEARVSAITKQLDEQRGITAQALAQIELFDEQIVALRKRSRPLRTGSATEISAIRHRKRRSPISGSGLTWRLPSGCRSLPNTVPTFSAELKKTLGDRDDIQVVGDRFVFQSEIFFESGSADLNPDSYTQLDKLATALQELESHPEGA